ncbi:hypothetical protein BDV36DRAFT_277833 [Aspergillus pseudocaelatus]|uniref:Uncharacterized protein n=1 Tax=Aspergillus pseudocaelatus TaxID=1825620 RepID=A0ABQ6VZW8_9EURO|nr:hypothetical protein BDV36DRAFT_277833 [Aspergillus pseudocaelatus]
MLPSRFKYQNGYFRLVRVVGFLMGITLFCLLVMTMELSGHETRRAEGCSPYLKYIYFGMP